MGYSFNKVSKNETQRIESDFKNIDEYIKNKYRLSKQPQADLENFSKSCIKSSMLQNIFVIILLVIFCFFGLRIIR
jgi:hypothetical protein